IAPDGNGGYDWFGVLASGSGGTTPLTFYHGKMDKNEKDAGFVTDNANTTARGFPTNDWHMSNLARSPDHHQLVCVTVRNLDAYPSIHFEHWDWDWTAFNSPINHGDWQTLV